MQKTSTHWPSLILLVVVVIGAALLLLAAIGFGAVSLIWLILNQDEPVAPMIAAVSCGLEALLLAGTAWFLFQKTDGRPEAERPLKLPFAPWHLLVILPVAAVALGIGALAAYLNTTIVAWLVLPAVTLLVIVPPIWGLVGLGTSGLDLGPRWRAFGIFGLGMTVGPLMMLIIEILMIVGALVVFVVVVASRPDLTREILRLAAVLQNESDPEKVLALVGPYLLKPGVIAALLGYISLAVPMTEELLKPLGIWLFARRIETPAQGFALGLVSGAAYALFESLGASGQGGPEWTAVVFARGGTSLLHVMTTGVMGWAIVSAFRERRFLQLPAAYLSVVLVHGLWNACAVATSFAGLSDLGGQPAWMSSVVPAAICGLVALALGMIVLLIASNRRIRKTMQPAFSSTADSQGVQ